MNKRLLFFSSPYCQPCKLLEPILKELGADYTKIDVTEDYEMANRYSVRGGLPVVISVDVAGDPIDTVYGLNPKAVYEKLMR